MKKVSCIELLENGLRLKDWKKIASVYTILSGNTFEEPYNEQVVSNDIDNRIDDLESRISELEKTIYSKNIIDVPQSNKRSNDLDFTVKQKDPVKKIKPVNKFEKIDISSDEIEDDLDSINDSIERTPRTRKPFSLSKVTCSECKKTLEVKSVLVRENYVCDRCINKRIS